MSGSETREYLIIKMIFSNQNHLDCRVVFTCLVTGPFDCVDDGPSFSGNDSPPTDQSKNYTI